MYAFFDWAGSRVYEQRGKVTRVAFGDKERTLVYLALLEDRQEVGVRLLHGVAGRFRVGNEVVVACQRGWLSHHLCVNGIDPI